MTPEVSAVIVNHRSAAEAAVCLESLRTGLARERVAGEILLVDCGSGPEEAPRLEALGADVCVLLPDNRGYSGGLNAGLARARAPRLLLANADVVFEPGAVTALLAEIEGPAAGAAAPLCLWDEKGTIRLPAGYAPGFLRDAGQLVAGRWPALDRRRFTAHARETLRLWAEGGSVRHLAGAVLAARRDVFDRAGRFDERFLFEYEESEWEERVLRTGLELRFTPRARVRHLWARSASRSPGVAERRAASRRLYRQRRYGRAGRAILDRLEGASRPPEAVPIEEPRVAARPGAALAISPNPSLLPFAGVSLASDFRLPGALIDALPAGPLYLRAFAAASGEPLETWVWEKKG
jgi:GT2 family glycosyltransferase